jgi:hypothetical protein
MEIFSGSEDKLQEFLTPPQDGAVFSSKVLLLSREELKYRFYRWMGGCAEKISIFDPPRSSPDRPGE